MYYFFRVFLGSHQNLIATDTTIVPNIHRTACSKKSIPRPHFTDRLRAWLLLYLRPEWLPNRAADEHQVPISLTDSL